MKKIKEVLSHFGIYPFYKGFKCIILAISLSMSDEYKNATTKSIYEAVAKQLNCHAANVERNIRTIVIKAWEINPEYLCRLSGKTLDKAPTNTEFIKLIVDELTPSVKCPNCGDTVTKSTISRNDILRSMMKRTLPAFLDNQQITSDNSEYRNACIKLIEYKVLRALYEISQEGVPKGEEKFSWDDCVKVMRASPELLNVAEPVVLYTMEDFIINIGFDYEATGGHLIEENEPGMVNGVLQAVKLFSEETGEYLYDFFFLNAEVMFYNQQLSAGKNYSWKEYLAEIQSDRSMWDKIIAAVHDAFRRMDFKVGWAADDLEETQFLHQPL